MSLKRIIGFFPSNPDLYEIAFVHRSASFADTNAYDINNERLEFLGDAVLDAIIADYLFRHFPGRKEGFLTKMRSKIVNRAHMDELASNIGLDELLIAQIGKATGCKHLYGNAFEALIGAIYLDRGYKKTREFIIKKIIRNHIDLRQMEKEDKNFKSLLVEWGQKLKKTISFETNEIDAVPSYFISHAKVDDDIAGTGKGFSKKEAEQNAAEDAINDISIDEA
ncbi:MAG: ribonuclease III [Bacteroidetes bacterium]|nr:ribonuclease III [Bacteroidota bacterium]